MTCSWGLCYTLRALSLAHFCVIKQLFRILWVIFRKSRYILRYFDFQINTFRGNTIYFPSLVFRGGIQRGLETSCLQGRAVFLDNVEISKMGKLRGKLNKIKENKLARKKNPKNSNGQGVKFGRKVVNLGMVPKNDTSYRNSSGWANS